MNRDKAILNRLYKELSEYSDFTAEDNIEKFLDTVDKIILLKDKESIKLLLSYFCDDTDYSWVFESISRKLDYFDEEEFINELLLHYKLMLPHAREWLELLLYRILNHPAALKRLAQLLLKCKDKSIIKFIQNMDDGSEPHHTIIRMLANKVR